MLAFEPRLEDGDSTAAFWGKNVPDSGGLWLGLSEQGEPEEGLK